jgi:hypothetical protein
MEITVLFHDVHCREFIVCALLCVKICDIHKVFDKEVLFRISNKDPLLQY